MNASKYCTISINSPGHVTRYTTGELVNSPKGSVTRYKK
jgi:hypothetical protein